jgi:hypothetical protein
LYSRFLKVLKSLVYLTAGYRRWQRLLLFNALPLK